jgi:hypothetical protein
MDNKPPEQEPGVDDAVPAGDPPTQPVFKTDPDAKVPDENFSLESLGQEPKAETAATPEIPEQKKQLYEALARESIEHRQGLESVLEARNLAEGLSKYETIDPVFLKNFLEIKKSRGLFGEHSAEELTQELLKIEENIIAPLLEKLKDNDFGLAEDQIEHCITGAREAFYGMIINERLSADKILEILGGGVQISKEPGEEISEEHRHMEDIAAYLHFNHESKKFEIHLYEGLFRENNKDIAFLFRHEFFHAAAYAIWGKRYNDFKKAAENPEGAIAAFEDVPELQQVLIMVSNPESSKPFFRDYIANILDAIETAPEEQKAFYRRQAAIEIVADLGAHFLEGSKSSDVFLDLRARYFKENPEQLIKTICLLEGVADKDELFERYSINPEEVPPQEIIRRLSASDKLQALFKSSNIWQEELSKRFENRGANLKFPEFDNELDEEGFGDEIELTQAIPTTNRFYSAPQTSSAGGSKKETAAETFLNIWDLITGKK